MTAQLIAFPLSTKGAASAASTDWETCRRYRRKESGDPHRSMRLAGGWRFDLHRGREPGGTVEGWQVYISAPGVPCVGMPYPQERNRRKPEAWFRGFDEATQYAERYIPLIVAHATRGPLPFLEPAATQGIS